jgi:hypothetical protein
MDDISNRMKTADWRTTLLQAIQKRVQSLLQPIANDQAAFRAETTRILESLRHDVARAEAAARDATTASLFSRWMEHPDALASRNETGQWLNWLGLGGEGVEVGVYRGDFSEHLLRTWDCRLLTSIDPWREFPGQDYVDVCNLPQQKHEENHSATVARLVKFDSRSRVVRATSEDAAATFANGSLDFVYLDAQHHYEAVREDIALWHAKIRKGGVMGGHDYLDGRIDSGDYGVKRAVDEFAAANGYQLIVTREPNWPSWFVRVD